MNIDHYGRLAEKMQFDNTPLLIGSAAGFSIGFLQYTYAVRLLVREGQGPITYWMQVFYVAHELTFVYLFAEAAPRYDYHWFFLSTSFALAVWAALEIFCMWYSIQSPRDRNAIFSPLFGKHPSTSAILTYTFFLQIAMFALVWILIEFFGAGCFLLTAALCNVLLIIGPTHDYLSRGSRNGLSIGYCLTNVACVTCTFAPFSMGVLVLPEIFDQTIVYISGAILLAYAVWLTTVVASYPPKTATKGQSAPIW
ncbi:ABC superfamily atp binding cassette transporter permease [Fusarium napiforme]|uniref:ABC superfamily atp binding cassette transporter permease n=1 Tax=Fusarium napiforme TaxID=42672 RepID=A0A8H5NG49_9HYPO|nr:ABC superfamily atp binding cassette transporter permease [Fusarium napiforme]